MPSRAKKIASVVFAALLAVVAYFCFWPVPAEPVAWQAQTPPGFTGAFAPNTRLAGLHIIDLGGDIGPEHIAIGDPADQRAQLGGTVQLVERLGNLTIVSVDTPAGQLVVEGNGEMAVTADATVGLILDPTRTHLFGGDGRII